MDQRATWPWAAAAQPKGTCGAANLLEGNPQGLKLQKGYGRTGAAPQAADAPRVLTLRCDEGVRNLCGAWALVLGSKVPLLFSDLSE